jgi:hypothetical protein
VAAREEFLAALRAQKIPSERGQGTAVVLQMKLWMQLDFQSIKFEVL